MLGCFNTEWKTLTWLRYSVWIPLYPLGVLAEGELVHVRVNYFFYINIIDMYLTFLSHIAVAVVQSIPIFDQTKLYSIPLPKAIGTSINFSYFLHVYLILMCLGKVNKQEENQSVLYQMCFL